MKHLRRLLLLPFFLFSITSCSPKPNNVTVENIGVTHETEFDQIYIKLTREELVEKGFNYGDSVNINFSNGLKYSDVPFYDGYYTKTGELVLVGYQGYPYVAFALNNVGNFWQNSKLTENDTATLSLGEKGKYLVNQQVFSMQYEDDRSKYPSDEVFANFRSLSGGNIKPNTIYRGASPIDNVHNRASYCDNFIKEKNVNFVLNLANTPHSFEECMTQKDFNSPYVASLFNDCKVSCIGLTMDYRGFDFKEDLASGLKDLINQDGPFYVHCTEGKDRTGFVCFILESLAGASYEEMKTDYMITYLNYYHLDINKDKDTYDAIVKLRFDDFCSFIAKTEDTNTIKNYDYRDAARNYLLEGGMDINEVTTLRNKISN